MGFKIVITDYALGDLQQIVEFVAQDDPVAAIRLGEKIIAAALGLAEMPARCPLHDRQRGIRKMTLAPYLIFYTCDETASVVNILHIWHGARRSPDFRT
jgi:plasmid stabilization system protein ParE